MSRLAIPARDDAPSAARPLLDAVHARFGVVPAMYRLLASAPSVLAAYERLVESMGAVLDVKTRERIALVVAQINASAYCLSAHSYLAMHVARICPEEIDRNCNGHAVDPRTAAILQFAARVADLRGHVADQDIAQVRAAGLTDAEILAVVALVAQNFFTNLINSVARTTSDFPLVRGASMA